jgi:hypothetical protein
MRAFIAGIAEPTGLSRAAPAMFHVAASQYHCQGAPWMTVFIFSIPETAAEHMQIDIGQIVYPAAWLIHLFVVEQIVSSE